MSSEHSFDNWDRIQGWAFYSSGFLLQAIFFIIILCLMVSYSSSKDNRLETSPINPHNGEEGGFEIPVEPWEEQLLLSQKLFDPLSLLRSFKAGRAVF